MKIKSILKLNNLVEVFDKIIAILKRYMVMEEKYYKIIALWIIGTYFHKDFETYPYLYINAVKGSGKTRLLKLIAFFSNNGSLIALPSQAYMFREAETSTFCLDELEHIDRKESFELRLLLNTAYKKGLFIPRMKQEDGKQIAEKFETYSPIAIANIWGLDDVLHDRTIEIRLEKSNKPNITKKIEVWDKESGSRDVKEFLHTMNDKKFELSPILGTNKEIFTNITSIWNDVLENMQNGEDFEKAFNSLDWSKYGIELSKDLMDFFNDLIKSKIEGRELELFLPLTLLANFISKELYKEMIVHAEEYAISRAEIDIFENKDSIFTNVVFNFIQKKEESEFYSIAEITSSAIDVIGEDKQTKSGVVHEIPYWFNNKFVGRALQRNNFVLKHKRMAKGYKVMLDFNKINIRAKMIGILQEEIQTTL